jgi:hypothetical protein
VFQPFFAAPDARAIGGIRTRSSRARQARRWIGKQGRRGRTVLPRARKFGAEALWLQAVPFALMHNGKPELETLSTIFGGFAFGWIAYRTNSFVWPFLIHWFIATFIIVVAAGLI